jgi:3-oxoacyl-(acyl-carrier-protein) synthase
MTFLESHNIISSLGFTSRENFERIKSGKTGIRQSGSELSPEASAVSLVDTEKLESCFAEISDEPENYTRYEKLLICSISNALKNSRIDIQAPDTLLIISTTKGNVNLREKQYAGQYNSERLQLWKSTGLVADYFKHRGKKLTVSNACISGSLAMIIAQRLIDAGKYKQAVVAGADILSEFTLSGFQAFKAVSPEACKPFDQDRQGMTPGEGAAALVLTSDSEIITDEKIQLSGGASSNDANHISGPSRTGNELAETVNRAIHEAGIHSDEIDYISAHGTATPFNDEMEAKALNTAGLSHVPLNSFKGNIGHTFGASGIAESILAAESLKQNELLPSFGFENKGTTKEANIIRKAQKVMLKQALKTASGFGGSNAALILTKNPKEKSKPNDKQFLISQSVIIDNFQISLINGKHEAFDFLENKPKDKDVELGFKQFSKSLYKELNCKYPKFYKMDKLCKLAFLGSELLLKNADLSSYQPEDIAIVLSNGSSSSETDSEYQKTINDRDNYFPSPKIFVYTLANIMAGEIAIRNGFKGENAVFIEEKFNKEFLFDYCKLLFDNNKAKAVIAGRINYDSVKSERYVELYLAEIKETLQ